MQQKVVMVCGGEDGKMCDIEIQERMEKVHMFKYLGCMANDSGTGIV